MGLLKQEISKINMTKVKERLLQLGLSSLTVASLTACGAPKNEHEYVDLPQVTTTSLVPDEETLIEEGVSETDEKPMIVIEEHQDNETAYIPPNVQFEFDGRYKPDGTILGYDNEGITYKDLKHVVKAKVIIISSCNPKEEDYDFLNYVPNIEKINLVFWDSPNINLRNVVDFSRFPNMKNVLVSSSPDALDISKMSFLKDFKHIDNLEFEADSVCIGEVNADNLKLTRVCNLLFDDLSKFKSIEIEISPYDYPTFLTKEMVKDLRSKGVEVIIKDEETFFKDEETFFKDKETVYIPPNVQFTLKDGYKPDGTIWGYVNEGITYKDLKHVVKAEVIIYSSCNPKEEDYDFLNYVPNVEEIYFRFWDHPSDINLRNIVDFSRFPNMKNVFITGDVNARNISFLKDFKHIDNLEFGESSTIYVGEVNADKLKLLSSNDMSFDDLSKFKSIEIDMSPYNSAIFLTKEMVRDLRSKGVEVIIKDEETFNEVNEKLANIIESLNITPSDTEEEKTRKIVTKIMEMCTYDPGVRKGSTSGWEFYCDGVLYPVLEGETQICGNYAGITTALARRADLEVYSLHSPKHLFNLIKIGDYYYGLDVTWLDSEKYIKKTNNIFPYEVHPIVDAFKQKDYERIFNQDNYLFDLTDSYTDPFEHIAHKPYYLPGDIELTEIPDDQEIKNVLLNALGKKKYIFKINRKTLIVTDAVLAGILVIEITKIVKSNRRGQTPYDDESCKDALGDDNIKKKRP